jgi:hypothetical protein
MLPEYLKSNRPFGGESGRAHRQSVRQIPHFHGLEDTAFRRTYCVESPTSRKSREKACPEPVEG